MLEKIKSKYMDWLVASVVGILAAYSMNVSTELKNTFTYHKTNIELDSLQTKQIRALSCNMTTLATKEELNFKDSIMLDKLNIISNKQVVFQNDVIERYDAKFIILKDNQNAISNDLREVIGVLKALHFITLEMYNKDNIEEPTVYINVKYPEHLN